MTEKLTFSDNSKKIEHVAYLVQGILLQIFLSIAVSLSNMSDGMSVGWTSTTIAQLTDKNSTVCMSLEEASLIGTLPVYTSFISLPICIYSANKIGRKWTILWGTFLLVFSWLCLTFSNLIYLLYVGVAFRGLSGTFIYTVPQVYIAEISDPKIRGLLGSFVPILMNFGIFFSYSSNLFLSLKSLAIIGTVVVAMVFPLFLAAPKSPYFLIMTDQNDLAKKSLQRFRGKINVDKEFEDIKQTVKNDNLEKGTICEFVTDKNNRNVLIIVIMVQVFQQLSGIDAIMIFLRVILQDSMGTISENMSSMMFGAAKLFSCAVALLLVDKIGRKPLLIFSCISCCASLAILGSYFYKKDVILDDVEELTWMPLTLLVAFVLGYNVGLGCVPFILGSELFPTRFRALGVGVNQVSYGISMILATEIFARAKDMYGFYLAFWIFSFLSLIGGVYCIIFVPETKGKTLKEIQIDMN